MKYVLQFVVIFVFAFLIFAFLRAIGVAEQPWGVGAAGAATVGVIGVLWDTFVTQRRQDP